MSKSKFVKIVKANRSTYWYSNSMGEIFEVNYNSFAGKYSVVSGEQSLNVIDYDDCVDATEREVLEYKIELANKELAENVKKVRDLEEQLNEFNSLKLSDMVAGNVFKGDIGGLFILTPCCDRGNQRLTLTGLNNDPQKSYLCGMYTEEGMLRYLKDLGAKKTNKKIVMVEK